MVGDRWQGLGLGTKLLEELADRARTEGVTRFAGVVLAENQDAIRLLERLGAMPAASGPELNFEIDLLDDDRAHPTLRELVRALAAGLLAKKAVELGLKRKPHPATSDAEMTLPSSPRPSTKARRGGAPRSDDGVSVVVHRALPKR